MGFREASEKGLHSVEPGQSWQGQAAGLTSKEEDKGVDHRVRAAEGGG